MSFWEYLGTGHQQLLTDAYQHASAVFQCMVVATRARGADRRRHLSQRAGRGNLATTSTVDAS